MNDYSFDYLNYMMNIPNNPQQIQNNMPFSMDYLNDNQINMNMMNKEQLVDPNVGLSRGNMFSNLYDPYKNFKQKELNATNEKEAMLYQLMQYKFALTDLNLYLDTNPNSPNAIALYQKYLPIEKQMCDKFENMYGPITVDCNTVTMNNNWNWNNSPWPWEVK